MGIWYKGVLVDESCHIITFVMDIFMSYIFVIFQLLDYREDSIVDVSILDTFVMNSRMVFGVVVGMIRIIYICTFSNKF